MYLLTRLGELIEIRAAHRPVFEVHVSTELASKPDLWGLACLTDGSLWTLETGHSLASLTREGSIVERVSLQLPWMALFGRGDQILFEALPIVSGVPVMAKASPHALADARPWPGLNGRDGSSDAPSATRNLLRCGLAAAGLYPCWFVDRPTVVLSSESGVRSIDIPQSDLDVLDREMPVWDVAVADRSRLWVLATSAPPGARRRADTVLLLGGAARSGRVRLPRPARLILFASSDRCTLLLETGEFLEVTAS